MTILAAALPIIGTIILFLALYANSFQGRLIFLVVLVANLAVVLFPLRSPRLARVCPSIRAAAMCVISAVGTVLVAEMLFPLLMPEDFSRMKDLADRTGKALSGPCTPVSRVFANEELRLRDDKAGSPSAQQREIGWHEPGKIFEYSGYDPNDRLQYVNRVYWNALGFFDYNYTFTRPANVYRIVFIGDSYVESIQVPLAATFHKMLESLLNRHSASLGSAPTYQVIALGNSGAGQQKNLQVLKDLGTSFHPDMVVFTLCSNDFCDDDPALHKERNVFLGQISPQLRSLLRHHYYVLAFALWRYSEIRRNSISVHPEFLQWSTEETPHVDAAWSRTLGLIKTARDYCLIHGIDFGLVYLGTDLEVKYALDPVQTLSQIHDMGTPYRAIRWDLKRSINRVTRFCQENGIRLITLLDPFVTAQKVSDKVIFGDHYTFFGHEIAAAELFRALQPNCLTYP